MQKAKRVTIATLAGLLFGFVCFGLAASSGAKLPMPVVLQIVASRTLIGVAIGISCLKLGHWSIHGLVLGALFSLPLAFSGLMAPESEHYTPIGMLVFTILLGMVYGLLIEVITSALFKAGAHAPQPPESA